MEYCRSWYTCKENSASSNEMIHCCWYGGARSFSILACKFSVSLLVWPSLIPLRQLAFQCWSFSWSRCALCWCQNGSRSRSCRSWMILLQQAKRSWPVSVASLPYPRNPAKKNGAWSAGGVSLVTASRGSGQGACICSGNNSEAEDTNMFFAREIRARRKNMHYIYMYKFGR